MSKDYYEGENFTELVFDGENFEDLEFMDCSFENCKFSDCTLRSINLAECRFTGCTVINADIEKCTARNCDLTDCNLIGISWSKFMANVAYSPIHSMHECFFKYNTFDSMNFKKFIMKGNSYEECLFNKCNLADADMGGCGLSKTQFSNCNLKKADFREASGYIIDTESNLLQGAKFSFPEVVNLLNSLGIEIF